MADSATPTRRPFRAGDEVIHKPSGETWLLACDEHDGLIVACGWPESHEPATDCELVSAATDEARIALLRDVAKSRGDHGESTRRARLATRQLQLEIKNG